MSPSQLRTKNYSMNTRQHIQKNNLVIVSGVDSLNMHIIKDHLLVEHKNIISLVIIFTLK